jgi:hypothetical protein
MDISALLGFSTQEDWDGGVDSRSSKRRKIEGDQYQTVYENSQEGVEEVGHGFHINSPELQLANETIFVRTQMPWNRNENKRLRALVMAGLSFESAVELIQPGYKGESIWDRPEITCDREECGYKTYETEIESHRGKDGLGCMWPGHQTCLFCNTDIDDDKFLDHRQTCGWCDITIPINDKPALNRHYFKVLMRFSLECLKTLCKKWSGWDPQSSKKISRSTCYNISLLLFSNRS